MKSTTCSGAKIRAFLLLPLAFVCACGDDRTPGPVDEPHASSGGSGGAGLGASGGSWAAGGQTAAGGSGSPQSGGTGPIDGCPGEAADAFEGSPATIPGRVEAENFDPAGYEDDTPGNEGGEHRLDVDVDIKALDDGFAVGWMNTGEWLEYTVQVEVAGSYVLSVDAAAVAAGRSIEISSCGRSLTVVDIPTVASWGEIGRAETTVNLEAGLQVLRVSVGSENEIDFDALTFEPQGAGSGGAPGAGGTSGTGGAELGEIPRFVGNITTRNVIDTDGFIYSDYWDQITPENAGKWGSIQGSASSAPNWGPLDAIYDYALEKGIVFKQHAFIWGTQQPGGNISEADVRTWMQSFCERYPATRLIDVVNEPPPHTTPSYVDAIGGGTNGNWQWVTNAFKWARESCPQAILILNDFNNIEWNNDNQHFIDITNTVLDNGGPIDAVGAQAHDLDNGSVSFQTVERLLNKLHDDTGLPVYVTELDLSYTDDQQQLQAYQQYFNFFREKEFVPGITIWGWIYGKTWSQAPNSGLIRDGGPRSAMTWMMNELERPVP